MNSTKIIKSLRAKKNLTQEQLAIQVGISRQSYNILENNMLDTELDIIFKILKILDINDNELAEFLFALKQDYLSYNNVEK